ncbi:MAG: hypothetical protein WKF71_17465 [Pyrinomonadaceae bacterium]
MSSINFFGISGWSAAASYEPLLRILKTVGGAGMFDFEEAHEMFDKGQIKEYEKIMEEMQW